MIKREVVIQREVLSTKDAAECIQIAMQYNSSLRIEYLSYQANPKSLMGMLCLGLRSGARITLTGDGDDEDMAVSHLEKFFTD